MEPIPIQLQLCPKCYQPVLFGQDSWKKHIEMCNKGHQIRTGSTATLESGPSCGQVLARREDCPLNERARTSQSFVTGRSTQGVIPNRLEIANKGGAPNSSQTDPPQVKAKTVEGVLPGVTANPTDLVEINDYDCELCDKTFRQLQLLRGHLISEHKVGPAQVTAIVTKYHEFEAVNDEDMDVGIGAVNVDHYPDYVAGERNERIGQKRNTVFNDFDERRRRNSRSVEILEQRASPEGRNGPPNESHLRNFRNETGSPNVEAHVMSDQGRSSAVRSSNRMQPPSEAVASFKCICNKAFARNCDRTDHIRRRHPDLTIVQCTECKFQTATSLMKEHISRSHGITQDQTTVASTSRALLTPQPQPVPSRHGISVSHYNAGSAGETSYSTTRNRTSNVDGKPLMSGVRTSYPPKTDLATGRASTGSTKTRMSTRSDTEKKYPCGQCRMIFRRPSYLEDHTAHIHEGKSPYICKDCGYQETCRYKMYTHMKIFHGIVGVPATRAANVSP